jgi:hypothetical protein
MVNEQQKSAIYLIELHTKAGLYSETTASDWGECLTLVRSLARAEPDKEVRVVRIEQLDRLQHSEVEQAVREARGG